MRVGGAGDDKGAVANKKAGVGAFPLLSPITTPPLELSQKEIQDGRETLLNPGNSVLSSIFDIDKN